LGGKGIYRFGNLPNVENAFGPSGRQVERDANLWTAQIGACAPRRRGWNIVETIFGFHDWKWIYRPINHLVIAERSQLPEEQQIFGDCFWEHPQNNSPDNIRTVKVNRSFFLVLFWVPKKTQSTPLPLPIAQGLASCALQLGGDERKTAGSNVDDLQHGAHQNRQVLEAKPGGVCLRTRNQWWTNLNSWWRVKKGESDYIEEKKRDVWKDSILTEEPHPTYLKQCHTYLTWEQPVKQGSHIFRILFWIIYLATSCVSHRPGSWLSYGYPWGVRTAPSWLPKTPQGFHGLSGSDPLRCLGAGCRLMEFLPSNGTAVNGSAGW